MAQKPTPNPTPTPTPTPDPAPAPGDGLRSLRTSNVFRIVNFELYAKPNAVIMGIGLTCMGLCVGYIAYMRMKYENMGYYSAINDKGEETFLQKKSKWDM